MRFGTVCATSAAILIGAGSAEAQYLHGRVIDLVTGEAVASASVLVLNLDESVRSGAVTDREGRFSFRTTPGTFRLRVQRVGYSAAGSKELELARTDTLNVEVRLAVRPTQIDPISVSATGAPLDPSGFFARRDDNIGRFLGPYEVERRRPSSPADLLHDIPGFAVIPAMGGYRVLMTGRGRHCIPTVYVDGRLAFRGTQTDRRRERRDDDGIYLEELINANAIRALEAYQSGATAPVRFRPVGPIGGGDCGVLVFWTRLGLGR